MLDSLDKRSRRAVIVGGGFAVAILLFHFVLSPWFGNWGVVRRDLANQIQQLEMADVREKLLAEKVPAFEMPESEDKQRVLFERKISEQLQAAGIAPIGIGQYVGKGKVQGKMGLKLLTLEVKGKGDFGQLLDFLANLNENPYLVSIEEFRAQCNKKNRQEITAMLKISTYAKVGLKG